MKHDPLRIDPLVACVGLAVAALIAIAADALGRWPTFLLVIVLAIGIGALNGRLVAARIEAERSALAAERESRDTRAGSRACGERGRAATRAGRAQRRRVRYG